MKTLVRAWDRFFFSRFDPYSLGLLRISTGALYLVLMGFLYFNWERFYGAEGFSGAVDPTLWQDPWTLFRFTDGVMSIMVWWWIGVVAGALFVVGFFTRTMSIVVFLLLSSMLHREILLAGAEDLVLRMVFFWLMLMPMGRSLSLDAWLRRRRLRGEPDPRPLPMIWATRMLQINVALIFAMSLPRKLTMDVAWLNGDAFYFAIINDTWAKWPWPEMFYVKWMSMLGTYGAILVEGAFPILVWTRWRVAMVIVMWSFHIMLATMLNNVALFSLSVAVTYWVFIPPETSREWLARAGAWWRIRGRPAGSDADAGPLNAPLNP